MRALEGGGPGRARQLARLVGTLTMLGIVVAGSVLLGGRPLTWARSSAWPLDQHSTTRPSAVPEAIRSPQASATPAARSGADDTLAAAQAIVAPASAPVRLVVPAIGLNAEVESLGLDAEGRMATPSRSDHVGWYSPGSAPGDAGNAVIDGHLDWTDGPAVFWRLGRLKRGDQLTVLRADGSQVKFAVQSLSTTPYDASTDALFTRSGPPALTLVTCAGAWDRQRGTYLQRLVVHASLVPPPPSAVPTDAGG